MKINHSFQINSLKNDFPPLLGELFCGDKNKKRSQIFFKRELI